jgi:hypothetical protein
MLKNRLLLYAGSAFLRLGLHAWGVGRFEAHRIGFLTPLTDLGRICEGLKLGESLSSPYAGWALHQCPLLLFALSPLCSEILQPWMLNLVFAALDAFAAEVLFRIAESRKHISPLSPLWVPFFYLFNPLSVLAALWASVGVIHNLLLLVAFLCASRKQTLLTGCFAALSVYCNLHAVMFVPALLLLCGSERPRRVLSALSAFVLSGALLIGASWLVTGRSWEFVGACGILLVLLRFPSHFPWRILC